MSEYGIKINNYVAGILYSYNLGTRSRLDSKPAMLTNSLFLDFLKENGLNVYKGESTRDVICIEFTCGSNSYEEEIKASKKRIERNKKLLDNEKDSYSQEQYDSDFQYETYLQSEATKNKDKYVKKSFEDIRIEYYTQGVGINYRTYSKHGKLIKEEYIHYKRLYRSAGKAKKGSCMFIRDELFDAANNFLTMGIELPFEKSPIVEMGAYSALITSTIVGKVTIKPDELLVIDDIDSYFTTNVVSIETDENRHCKVVHRDNYDLKNCIFDGQALIDSSIFPHWGDGYILLRHHMCKMAAFNSNIQLFFKDYYGDDYETATIKDVFGNTLLAKNIKLITTPSAMKWLTFKVSYDYWLDWVMANGCQFGIVKTAHESKMGEVQRMSYQMVNALDIDAMDSVLECSQNFIDRLKNDDAFFLQYLRDNTNFSNDYEVLVALCEHNVDFIRSDYFRERRYKITQNYLMDLRIGKLIQPADNLVIVGSPYAMLLSTVGEDIEQDTTFKVEVNCIQCYTGKFKDGEYLAGFRSPFNGRANMDYLHNTYSDIMLKYFNFGKQIIAVNMLHTQFQDKNNGSDQDSDSLYVTNQDAVVKCAEYCFNNYPTIVNNIPKEKNIYTNTFENMAKIDNNLASYQNAIGQSSNLAQVCLTYSYNFPDAKYEDYVCLLSVLAQVAIDNAKRSYDIDLNQEIKAIKDDMNIDEHKYPLFYADVQNKKRMCIDPEKKKKKKPKKFDEKNINKDLMCPMNCIRKLKVQKIYAGLNSTIPFADFIIPITLGKNSNRRKSKKVEELIEKYSIGLYRQQGRDGINWEDDKESMLLLKDDFDDLLKDIQSIYISKNYRELMWWLINRAFQITEQTRGNMESLLSKNKALLLKVLYSVNKDVFLQCFIEKKV